MTVSGQATEHAEFAILQTLPRVPGLLGGADCLVLVRQATTADIRFGMGERGLRSLGKFADEIFIGFR